MGALSERSRATVSRRHSSTLLSRRSSPPAGAGYTPFGGVRPRPLARAVATAYSPCPNASTSLPCPPPIITHPSFLLHDMGPYHPECPDAAARDRRPADRRRARRLPAPLHGAGGDARAARARARRALHRRRSRRRARTSGLHFIDPDTALNPHSLAAARHAAGAVVLATDLVVRGECRDRVLRGAPAGAPCGARARDGLLPVQQRRGRRGARARGARPRARRDRRLRRPPRQRHRGHLHRRPARADGRRRSSIRCIRTAGIDNPAPQHGQRAAAPPAAAARNSAPR